MLKNIRNISEEEIKLWLKENDEKPFRTNQILNWIWQNNIGSFSEMKNISKALQQKLSNSFFIDKAQIYNKQKSIDGTIKILLNLHDNYKIETVLIPTKKRITVCVSSQVGCQLGCSFCATATMGFTRNLSVGEIVDQLFVINQLSKAEFNKEITNVVFMGMGEPLLNYSNLSTAIQIIHNPKYAFGLSHKNITVSTIGVEDKILTLAEKNMPCNLAVSLHAATDEKRRELMPYHKTTSLKQLKQTLQKYNKLSDKIITIEYLLIEGVNNSIDDVRNLLKFCYGINCKINLIEYNPIAVLPFKKSKKEHTSNFYNYLKNKNIQTTIRKSMGEDIFGACGQLANHQTKEL